MYDHLGINLLKFHLPNLSEGEVENVRGGMVVHHVLPSLLVDAKKSYWIFCKTTCNEWKTYVYNIRRFREF